MTPQYIMRKGITDYLRGMLDGKGNYVKKVSHMDLPWDTLDYHKRQAESEVENLDWYEGFSGYPAPERGILVANWNCVSNRTQRLLERYGFVLDWSDEVVRCDDCNLATHSTPQFYGDQRTVTILEDGCWCASCAEKNHAEELIDDSIDNPRKAILLDLDLSSFGFTQHNEIYESGWYPGQNDDPREIYERLKRKDNQVIFKVTEVGQFDVRFEAWVKGESQDD